MPIKSLIQTELKVAFDKRFFPFFILIVFISAGFPFYGIATYLGGQLFKGGVPIEFKNQIAAVIESTLLVRFSLTIYLISAWAFIPKLFYSSKESGEVESMLAVGYSGKKIWFAKALAVMLVSSTASLPLILIINFCFRWYIMQSFGITMPYNILSLVFAFVINPLIVFSLILFVGGFQLLSDDVRRSSMAVFIIAILNIGIILGNGNSSSSNNYSLYLVIYGVMLFIVGIIVLWLSKRMDSENILLSSLKKLKGK